MNIDIKYGKDGVQKVDIPDENLIGIFYPKDVECGAPDEVINASIDDPMGYDSLDQFLDGGKDIVLHFFRQDS